MRGTVAKRMRRYSRLAVQSGLAPEDQRRFYRRLKHTYQYLKDWK